MLGGDKAHEEKMQKLGLPLKSRYRIVCSLYQLEMTKIPPDEICKAIEIVKKIIKETDEAGIRSYAQEVLKNLEDKK